MKKTISILLACALALSLAGCSFAPGFPGLQFEPVSQAPQAEAQEDAQEKDYTTGTPWPDIDLQGVVTADTPAELKDNFALYVNKDAILGLEIPEGYPYAGTLIDVSVKNAEDMKNMFLGEAPDSHDAKLAYDLFWLMMDWEGRNALGVAPLKAEVDIVEAISSIDELYAYITEVPFTEQLGSLWGAGSSSDLDHSDVNILTVGPAGLLLGDSAEYITLTDYGAMKKAAYTELAQKMLGKLGYSEEETAQKIDNSFAFETLLAPAIMTNEENSRPDYLARINNHFTREELQAAQQDLPILEELAVRGYPEADDYLVTEPAYLEKLNEVCTEENLPLIKDSFIVKGAIGAAGTLDRECYEWLNDCANAITGSTGILDDETAFSGDVAGALGWPVARLYTEEYLKQEDKDRIGAMIDEILEAYHGIILEADFLSDETREKAIEKLESIKKGVLYPDSWEKYEYEDLNFASKEDGGTYWDALVQMTDYSLAKNVREYSEPVDKEKWVATPQTVNCFYNPQANMICILGAFAQGNIYNSDMSDEELYGKLGVVIGHEISHAFDSTGAQFDKNGDMTSWWTEEDYAKFLERNEKMTAYYNAMHPWEGQDFYGSIVTGEACADMAGLKCMLRIAAGKPDFDYDLFFRSYANVWLTKDSLQMAYRRINDVHPMAYLRINATLQQFDEFLDLYGITEGDGMYLAPEDRVLIW